MANAKTRKEMCWSKNCQYQKKLKKNHLWGKKKTIKKKSQNKNQTWDVHWNKNHKARQTHSSTKHEDNIKLLACSTTTDKEFAKTCKNKKEEW
jgi:hypothetical protein